MSRRHRAVLIGLLAMIGMVGCGGSDLPDNSRLLSMFEEGRTGVWVSGHGTVTQVLADSTIGAPRQRFMLRISEELNVLVHHSLVDSERVPVERGDVVAFQGRYEFNASGGVISLTHRDPAQPGSGGWIRLDEQVYD